MSDSSMERWMDKALEFAQRAADEDEVPVGALIVQNGKQIGSGYNRRENNHNPIAHAEIEAIVDASRYLKAWRLNDCELFVTLEPCMMCLGAIQQARISAVYYGAEDPKGGALSLGYKIHCDERTNHRFDVVHLPNPQCKQILSDFFRDKRAK